MLDASSTISVTEQLCLHCGICCNGVLFKDVELQPGDDVSRLHALGLQFVARAHPSKKGKTPKLPSAKQQLKFPQPCAALGADCRCRIYAARPSRCRDFECALFHAVEAGELQPAQALRTIRAALEQANRVKELLRELGDTDELLPLSLRFQRTRKRVEAGLADEQTADTYSLLTLAVHDLQFRLRREFYPGGRA